MKSQTPALESMAEIWHVLPKGHVEWGLGCSHWVWSHGGPCALGRGMTTRPAGSGREEGEAARGGHSRPFEGGGRRGRKRSGSGRATWRIRSSLFKTWRDQGVFGCFWDVHKNGDDEDGGGTGAAESEGPLGRTAASRLAAQAEGGLARRPQR